MAGNVVIVNFFFFKSEQYGEIYRSYFLKGILFEAMIFFFIELYRSTMFTDMKMCQPKNAKLFTISNARQFMIQNTKPHMLMNAA